MFVFAPRRTAYQVDPPADEIAPDPATPRVLFVEDTDALRVSAVRILRAEGYVVAEARHGQDALNVIERAALPFDVVLTDVTMPVMSGYKLGRLLAHSDPSLPVLYMSSAPSAAMVRCGLPAGPTPFLRKPFLPEELIREVAALVALSPRCGGAASLVT
jgi:CheY-like chemotaxis protein